MAATIESLYNDFRSNYEDKAEYSIDFYTTNVLFFNNIISFNDVDALKMYIHITCRYTNALFSKGHFNECIDVCDKNLALIDDETLRLNANEVKDDWYLTILFNKGKSCYNLKDFKTSTPVFKALINYDPKNDKYKIWLRDSKYSQNLWITYLFFTVSIGLFGIDLVFKTSISLMNRNIMSGISLSLLAIGWLYNSSYFRSLRNK